MKYLLSVVVIVLGGLVVATLLGETGDERGSGPESTVGEEGSPGGTTEPPVPPASDENTPPGSFSERFEEARDVLRDGLAAMISDLVTGAASPDQRMDLERRLILVMEEERLGDSFTRAETARTTISKLLEEMARFMPARGRKKTLDGLMKAAIKTQASALAADIRSRQAPSGGGVQHQGVAMAAIDFQPPKGYELVRWAHIGGFEYRDHMKLPESVVALKGRKVAAAGYMITLGEVEDIREFLLVESGWSCCFGIPPDVNQVIEVRIPKELPGIEFTTTPIAVMGVMDVGEEVEDGFVISVYRIQAEKVVDVE